MPSTPPVTENKMGVMPINRLLISMSLPMMISMLVQALYNIVDSIFVSQLSEDALTAVSLAFPIQNLMIAVGVGTGVGVNALLSRSLGQHNPEKASQVALHGILLSGLNCVLFLLFGLFFPRLFFTVQTDAAAIVDGGTAYLQICTCFSLGLFGQVMFERLLQSTGRTLYAMVSQCVGAVTNIILDPILIFGYLGAPRMGVAGAAVATVIGQFVAMFVAVALNLKCNPELSLSFRGFRVQGRVVGEIYAIGVPSIIMASIGSVMTFLMNKILLAFTSTATAVFGVYFKLQSFVFMPVFGLNNGMVPILSYNYGAQRRDRMTQTIRLSVLYAVAIMLVGFLAMQAFPALFLRLFEASDTMLAIGVPALRIISTSFIFAGFCIVASSVFQSLGHGLLSMFVSIARQLLVLLPAAYLLSLSGNVDLIWWSFPIAELAAVLLCSVFLARLYRATIQPLPLPTEAAEQPAT